MYSEVNGPASDSTSANLFAARNAWIVNPCSMAEPARPSARRCNSQAARRRAAPRCCRSPAPGPPAARRPAPCWRRWRPRRAGRPARPQHVDLRYRQVALQSAAACAQQQQRCEASGALLMGYHHAAGRRLVEQLRGIFTQAARQVAHLLGPRRGCRAATARTAAGRRARSRSVDRDFQPRKRQVCRWRARGYRC